MNGGQDEIHTSVKIDFQGHVQKRFLGANAHERFNQEQNVLRVLEERGCPNVPRLLEAQADRLTIITTNCGAIVPNLSVDKAEALFRELEEQFGIRHDHPDPRYVVYSESLGRFCLMSFEGSEILPDPMSGSISRGTCWRARWVAQSRRGHKHDTNDDSYLAMSVDSNGYRTLAPYGEELLTPSHLALAVCDGMGGRNAGDFASRLVLNFLKKDAVELYEVIESGSGGKRALDLLTKATHDGLLALSSSDPRLSGCGTTFTLAWITPATLYWVHVGDSRLYLKDGEHIEQLTEDDCRLWHSLKNGEITEYAYRTDPRKSRLSDVMGGGPHRIQPQTGCIAIEPGARLLLCTDGVMDGLWDRQIEDRFGAYDGIRVIAEEMLETACENDPKDDTTLIVAEFDVV